MQALLLDAIIAAIPSKQKRNTPKRTSGQLN